MSGGALLETLQQFRAGPFGFAIHLLDIFLLAFIIYRLFLLIRGTRAVQMFLGVIFLLVFYWVAGLFGMETVHRVLGNILFYIPFAIIVIFQNTIRRALASFGTNPLLRPTQPVHLIDELILAARSLAQRKIGALIVIEREQGLRNFIETGILIDAIVSYDLLLNIFIPRTPLHDGAVIIQEGRIRAASTFLPLTTHPALSKDFGTRHRAAVGVTEETDAIAVVVSEERGEVSLAFQGRMFRDLDDESLRSLLLRNLRPAEEAAEERVDTARVEEVHEG